MTEVKFKKTTSTDLDSVPVSDGQIVAVTDTGELHIDHDGTRTKYGSSVKMYFDTDANILATDSTDTEALYYATNTGRIYRRIYVQDALDGSGPYYIWLNINGVNQITAELGLNYNKKYDITGFIKILKALQTGAGMWFSATDDLAPIGQLHVYDPTTGNAGQGTFRSFYPTTTIDTMVGECVKNVDIYTDTNIHVGSGASASEGYSVAVGYGAEATAAYGIQLGWGKNSLPGTLSVGLGELTVDPETESVIIKTYTLLEQGGFIPEERIPDTIARKSAIPDTSNFVLKDTYDTRVESTNVYFGEGSSASTSNSVAIGTDAKCGSAYSIAIGYSANASNLNSSNENANYKYSVAIGYYAKTKADHAIQLGCGTNSTPNTFSVGLGNSNNYLLLTSDGKIPIERIPDGVGGSSWTSEELSDTTISSFCLDDCVTYFSNDLASADFTDTFTVEGMDLLTTQSVLHFHSGSTATTVTCGNVKFIGLHCYAGVFTPVANTYYTITFYWNGGQYVGSVGGYAG